MGGSKSESFWEAVEQAFGSRLTREMSRCEARFGEARIWLAALTLSLELRDANRGAGSGAARSKHWIRADAASVVASVGSGRLEVRLGYLHRSGDGHKGRREAYLCMLDRADRLSNLLI